jgi:hypothetical protein
VLICASCGQDNPVGARFCNGCGAALAATAASREVRKTVTVLFCDLAGSTALGEQTDPEALRALLARYFERMKAIVESHGGTVEKFIGAGKTRFRRGRRGRAQGSLPRGPPLPDHRKWPMHLPRVWPPSDRRG